MLNKRSGFSLLEMMAVLLVMAMLAGLVMPAVVRLRGEAERMLQANQVREVSMLWQSQQGRVRAGGGPAAEDLAAWLERAARAGLLQDPSLLILADDPAVAGRQWPETVLQVKSGQGQEKLIMNPELVDFPFSFVVVQQLPRTVNQGRIPIVWTRGLQRNGYWRSADGSAAGGVFATGGGWIGFLDGSVQFFQNLEDNGGELRDFRTGERTHDILRALPPGVKILGVGGSVPLH